MRYKPVDIGMMGFGGKRKGSEYETLSGLGGGQSSGHEAGGSSKPTFPSQFHQR